MKGPRRQKEKSMSKREFLTTLSIQLNNKLPNCTPTVIFSEEFSAHVLKIESNNQPFLVNIDAVYHAHIHGMTIDAIVDALCDSIEIRNNEPQNALYEIAQHFESAAPFLYATVESANNNSLQDKPYFRIMDLAVTYYIEFVMRNGTICKATLTDDVFENWNIPADVLHNTAVTNTFTKKDPKIVPIANAIPSASLSTIASQDELNSLLVISNDSTMFGAINMFNMEILNNAAFLLCAKEIYIIPSSIHEIIVCAKDDMDSEQLKSIIKEVNESFVREDEILSNNLYLFNRETKKIVIL